ncbi:MAG TPA: sigma-70 family RNA polymerase sigma factor, partial [Burkholderiaceae bacterium]|nr:sigma-70 family RNA polymerase sigma factor [Burkholderiaceae bacterium]
ADVIWLGGDRARHDGEEDEDMGDASEGPFEQPERAALRAQMRELIEAAIDGLPAELRVVFVLRAVEDLSVEQTAQCLGIPQPTVRTRYFRARGRLRDALAREFDTCLDDAFSFAGERCDRIVAGVLERIDAAAADVMERDGAATGCAPSKPPEQG